MITTLSGSNDFMIDSELKKILASFEDKYDDNAIEQIDVSETDVNSVIEGITGLSLFSPNKLIILKKGSSNKQFIDSAEKIISDVPDTNEVVIVEPNIDKRLSYYKLLKKQTEFKSYDQLSLDNLIRWIVEVVQSSGGSIKPSDARYLVELAGENQLKLSNEIAKLISFDKDISGGSIDDLVEPIPQSTIFQLLDSAFAGNSRELLRIYDEQKKQKVEPLQIISMLGWQVHILAMIKAAGNMSSSEIASKTKVSPFVISKSMNIARKLTRDQIQKMSSSLLELDIKLKSQSADANEALLQLLLTISSN